MKVLLTPISNSSSAHHMRTTVHALAVLFVTATFLGCDYVGEPAVPSTAAPPPEQTGRRVLIEDFTGHTCPNCPAATATGMQLQGIYGDENLIVVGLHVTQAFAAPIEPLGDGEFDTDFRTPAGDTYATSFGISFLPVGAVNRSTFGSSTLLSHGSWSSAVAEIIGEPASVDLWFDAFTFDNTSGQVDGTVGVTALEDLVGDYNITIYLTEDSVVADQIDNTQTPSHVHDYLHRHVLRGTVNGIWGEPIIAVSASAGDSLSSAFDFTLPANVINAGHCSLIAYVYDVASNEILQVVERKF